MSERNSNSGKSGWRNELHDLLAWPRRSAEEVPNLTVVTEEVWGWLHDKRPYEGRRHKTPWLSVLEEFLLYASETGPKVREVLGGSLDYSISSMQDLYDEISTKTHSEARSYIDARRPSCRSKIKKLKEAWKQEDFRAAAWSDLVACCKDASSPLPLVKARLNLFEEAVRSADIEVGQLFRNLRKVLDDSAFGVLTVRMTLGEIPAPQKDESYAWPGPNEIAGLSANECISYCHRLITDIAKNGQWVVWLAMEKGSLGVASLNIGSITFYESSAIRSTLEHPDLRAQANTWLPEELLDSFPFVDYKEIPEEQDVVLVRVDLGEGRFTDPVRIAREQAEGAVALASFHSGEQPWRVWDGYLKALDGQVVGTQMFGPPWSDDELVSGRISSVGDHLEMLSPKIAHRFPLSDADFTEIVKAVRWWQEAKGGAVLSSIILYVRILEFVASRVSSDSWQGYLDGYLKNYWIHWRMLQQVHVAILNVRSNDFNRLLEERSKESVECFLRSTYRSESGRRYMVTLDCAVEQLSDISGIYPSHSALGRRIADLSDQLSSVQSLENWSDGLECEWKTLREKISRIRNSLAHGGPINEEQAATVLYFVRQLAAWSLSISLEGIFDEKGVRQAHEEVKISRDSWKRQLPHAASVRNALFIEQE